ncbi:hypothetical protein ACWG8W_17420 [Citricoccus zhacaiensis]
MTQKAPAIPSAGAFVAPWAYPSAGAVDGDPVQQVQAGVLDRLAVGLDHFAVNAAPG